MSKSILVVEDYLETIALFHDLLANEGFQVNLAETGEKALEMMRKHDFDLVLLDIMLPRVDGFSVCRMIKKPKPGKKAPIVIVVTALDIPDIGQKATEAGADEVILKPFDAAELLRLVNKYLCPPA